MFPHYRDKVARLQFTHLSARTLGSTTELRLPTSQMELTREFVWIQLLMSFVSEENSATAEGVIPGVGGGG